MSTEHEADHRAEYETEHAREHDHQHDPHHDNHGRTPANWTGATIVMLAFTVGTIGVVIGQPIVFGLGVLLLIAGMVVWKVMTGMEPTPDAQ